LLFMSAKRGHCIFLLLKSPQHLFLHLYEKVLLRAKNRAWSNKPDPADERGCGKPVFL
jgi:hypothetical protein